MAKSDVIEDEVVVEDVETELEGKDADAAKGGAEPSEVEKIAMEAGWKPEADWKGDKSNWTDAGTFLRSLPKKVEQRGKQLSEQEKSFDKRVTAMERTLKKAHARDKERLTAHYDRLIKEAIKADDDEAIEDLREEKAEAEQALDRELEFEPTPEQVEAAETEFVENFPISLPKVQKTFWEKHAWLLDEESDLEDFDMIESIVSQAVQGGKTLVQALDEAEDVIMRQFSERYDAEEVVEDEPKTSPRRQRTPVLASASRSGARTPASRLPPAAKAAAKRGIDEGLFATYAEYAEIYVQEGGELLP